MHTIEEIKSFSTKIFKQYPIKRASLFGSYANGKMNENSDIDILIELNKPISMLKYIHIQNELIDLLGKKVDLLQYKMIRPELKESILANQVDLYEA